MPDPTAQPSRLQLLTDQEALYLRKALRYRAGRRSTPPSGANTTQGISLPRRRDLDKWAEWLVGK